MTFALLSVPYTRLPARDWSTVEVLEEHPEVEGALIAALRLSAGIDPDLLVLGSRGSTRGMWAPVAEGRHLVAWARLEGLGTPRVRWDKSGERLLCGWSTCGGTLAHLVRGDAYLVETLVRARPQDQRDGLPTWRVRGTARRSRTRPTLDVPIRGRQQRAMATGPAPQGIVANFVHSHEAEVVLVECSECSPAVGRPRVSILVPRLHLVRLDRRFAPN